MAFWLMKSEPDVYGIDHLQAEGTTLWDGIRNYQARNFMRSMLLALDARMALIMVCMTVFGRAISEVGAVMIVGGNIEGYTRVMTTAIALETSKGDLPMAMALGMVLLAVVLPAVTMRLVAEEKKTGTLELLVTLPVTDVQIVLGKLLGAFAFLAVTVLLTLVLPLMVAMHGHLDFGAVVGGYVGLMLIGTAFLALGLMCSTWTHNQIVAFLVGLLLCMFFGFATDYLLKLAFQQPPSALQLLSFQEQFQAFERGVIDLRNVVYFASVTAVAVVASTYSLQSRQWR